MHVKNTAAIIKKEGLEKLYSEWCKKKSEAKAAAEESNGQPLPHGGMAAEGDCFEGPAAEAVPESSDNRERQVKGEACEAA